MDYKKFANSEPETTEKDKAPIEPETWGEKVKKICTSRWGTETEMSGTRIDLLCTEFKKYLDDVTGTKREEREREIRPLFLKLVARYVGSPQISAWEKILFENQKNQQKIALFREGLFENPVSIPHSEKKKEKRKKK